MNEVRAHAVGSLILWTNKELVHLNGVTTGALTYKDARAFGEALLACAEEAETYYSAYKAYRDESRKLRDGSIEAIDKAVEAGRRAVGDLQAKRSI